MPSDGPAIGPSLPTLPAGRQGRQGGYGTPALAEGGVFLPSLPSEALAKEGQVKTLLSAGAIAVQF